MCRTLYMNHPNTQHTNLILSLTGVMCICLDIHFTLHYILCLAKLASLYRWNVLTSSKQFIVPLKKWHHTKQITTDKSIHTLNYQWQASIHFNWQMVGQYDVIIIGTIKSLTLLPPNKAWTSQMLYYYCYCCATY